MTRTQVDMNVDNDQPEVLPNRPLAEVIDRNLHLVGAAVNAATAGLEAIPIAARALAATGTDLFRSPAAIDGATKDLANRTNGRPYT